MACLTKIQSAITYDCDSGNVGLVSALLINKEDIATISFDSTNASAVASIKLKEGATAYKIDTVKRTLVTTESLKVNEGAPNAYTHTVTLTVTGALNSPLLRDIINPAANGSFVIATRVLNFPGSSTNTTHARVFGLYYGLSVNAVERSSHENGGWYTITMATPERVIGEGGLTLAISEYMALYNSSVG